MGSDVEVLVRIWFCLLDGMTRLCLDSHLGDRKSMALASQLN